MKFVFYDDFKPGLLKGDRVIDISEELKGIEAQTPQLLLEGFIKGYDGLKPSLEKALKREGVPVKDIRLRQPVPKPGLFLCGVGGYGEGEGRKRPLDFFLKGWTSISGDGDTVTLPHHLARIFNHEAELAVVFGKTLKDVSGEEETMDGIFGYTTMCDVSARAVPDVSGFWPQKSFDGFGPMGPCLVTKDEIPDPYDLAIKLWVNGELRQDYNTNDMSHDLPAKIKFLSEICTLNPGDVMACGTNHHGLGPLQDGDVCEMEIERIGRLSFNVVDPHNRTWDVKEHTRP